MQIIDYTGMYIQMLDALLPCYISNGFVTRPSSTITIKTATSYKDYILVDNGSSETAFPQNAPAHLYGYLLSQVFLGLLGHADQMCAVHCAVLIQNQSAILAVGKSHCGKSYLCKEALMHHSVNCLSDDFALVNGDATSISICNAFKPIYLRKVTKTENNLLQKQFMTMNCRFAEEEKVVLFNYKPLAGDMFNVKRVVFLSREEGAVPSLQAMKTNDSYARLMRNMLSGDLALNRQCIKKICDTVECVSCVYVIRRRTCGRDFCGSLR